jgi:hypothetical protein
MPFPRSNSDRSVGQFFVQSRGLASGRRQNIAELCGGGIERGVRGGDARLEGMAALKLRDGDRHGVQGHQLRSQRQGVSQARISGAFGSGIALI